MKCTTSEDRRKVQKLGPRFKNDKSKYKYAGILPECINIGCCAIVALRHITVSGVYSFFTECSRCKKYRAQGYNFEDIGIVQWKKDYCENQIGMLGFKCPVKIEDLDATDISGEQLRQIYRSCLQYDHIDGDGHNNTPENVVTLCSICHQIKSVISGDTLREGYRTARNGRVGEDRNYNVEVSNLEKFM